MCRRVKMEQEREDASIAIRNLENVNIYADINLLGLIAIAKILYFIAIILYKRLK